MTRSPFTNVYGLARTLLASSMLVTLLTSNGASLFTTSGPSAAPQSLFTLTRWGLINLLAPNYEWARWIAVAALSLVASGFRPRLTGVLHWWISASLFRGLIHFDGGDQCAAVLTLLLVPLTLCDSRRWHWSSAPPMRTRWDVICLRIGQSSLVVARLQVAVLYLNAAVAKASVPEWVDGTALYYWLLNTTVGIPAVYHDIVLKMLSPVWVTPALTLLRPIRVAGNPGRFNS